MGIWRRWGSSQRRSPSPIAIERKIIRFRRLVEQHGEILDLFADLKDKQSGEYILDRQYIEARLDRAYEGVRRILYDMQVLSDENRAEVYDQLDRLRSVSEKILRDAQKEPDQQTGSPEEEALDWETLALQALFQDLTRLPAYGPDVESRGETANASPESLTEWAGWGHLMAAQWIAQHLPSVSPAPFANLCDEETGELRVQVFVLGGARESEEALRLCLAPEPSDRTEASSLLPLRTFMQGMRSPMEKNGKSRLRLEYRGKQKAEKRAALLDLYAGADFLLLRLPSSLPLQLFWCSLSLQPSENLIYLYGTPLPSLFEQGVLEPFSSEKEPFHAYRCGIAGRWMYWASHFSWAQGEERVRMLGHFLSRGINARGDEATQEDMSKHLQEGIAGFLKQTALAQREA
jgi:hypothetical protein